MILQLFNIPHTEYHTLAVSGGSDSMAVAHFYAVGRKRIKLAYMNHGTTQADQMEACVADFANKYRLPFVTKKIKNLKPTDLSPEEFWRNERYDWFRSFGMPVITAHHLDDAVETWIFTSINGTPRLIPSKNGLIFRPFLLNRKDTLLRYCIDNKIRWVEDLSNQDRSSPRNRIRHNIIPEILKINPGLHKTIKKKIMESYPA